MPERLRIAENYMRHAAECRDLAARMSKPDEKAMWLRAAEEFDSMAFTALKAGSKPHGQLAQQPEALPKRPG